MSLASLNKPFLVAGLGIGLHIAFPYIEALKLPYSTLRFVNLITYGLNTISTSIPGRIDGQAARDLSSASKDGSGMKELSPQTGKSLVAPSGWAFIIWAPIFLGELVVVTSQFLVDESSTLANTIRMASIPFSMAQIFQCLWCASFRPKYEGQLMFISTGMLSSIAYSLSKAHSAYVSSSYNSLEYIIHFLPMTLHFGWTTAASLVNLNGAVASLGDMVATPKVMAGLGHASALVGTVLGVYITASRKSPVYGGVIAWALLALSDSMRKRIKLNEKKKDDSVPGLFGAIPQEKICLAGALVCATSSVFVAFNSK